VANPMMTVGWLSKDDITKDGIMEVNLLKFSVFTQIQKKK
jgi:hypothetical protein